MTLLEYIQNSGKCKSKSGHWFVFKHFKLDEKYPIKGYLKMKDYDFPCEWTEDGVPKNLPYTHGLDLMPVVPVVDYKMVDKSTLSNYQYVQDFIKDQGLTEVKG